MRVSVNDIEGILMRDDPLLWVFPDDSEEILSEQ